MENKIKEKIKNRILTNVIDLIFIQVVVAFTLDKSLILLFLFGVTYLIFIYKSGYTFGSLFSKNKLYWYGEKTPYLFVKRLFVSVVYIELLFTMYKLKYNNCGQYEYDVKFKTYFNDKECNKNQLGKLIELNTFGFHLKWYIFYFGIYVFLLFIISIMEEFLA